MKAGPEHTPFGFDMTDFFGNQVQAIFQATTIVLPLVGDKRVRILGIAAQERSPLLPDVPTLAEQGFPLLVADSWNGLSAPAGTSTEIVRRLNHEVNEALKSAELKATYAKLGITANIVSPDGFGEFLKEETVRWAKEMLAQSPLALRLLKSGYHAGVDGLAGVQQLAGDATLLYYMTGEAQEGRDAYVEKRAPDFSRFPKRP